MTASGLPWNLDALLATYIGDEYRKNRSICGALYNANEEFRRVYYHEPECSSAQVKHLIKTYHQAKAEADKKAVGMPDPTQRWPNERGTEPLRWGGRQSLYPAGAVERVPDVDDAMRGNKPSLSYPVPKWPKEQPVMQPYGGQHDRYSATGKEEGTKPFGRSSRIHTKPYNGDVQHANNQRSQVARYRRSVSEVYDPRYRYRPSPPAADLSDSVEIDITPPRVTEKQRQYRLAAERAALKGPPRAPSRIIERADGSAVVFIKDET